jgi:hypothetical protein
MIGSSCYSGAAINYSSAHQQHSHQKKRSFKTKNLSRKKLPDSNEKTKKKKKISISEEEHSREGERRSDENKSVRTDGRKNKQHFVQAQRNLVLWTCSHWDLDQDPLICTHVPAEFMATRQKYQRTFRANIPIYLRNPFHT